MQQIKVGDKVKYNLIPYGQIPMEEILTVIKDRGNGFVDLQYSNGRIEMVDKKDLRKERNV